MGGIKADQFSFPLTMIKGSYFYYHYYYLPPWPRYMEVETSRQESSCHANAAEPISFGVTVRTSRSKKCPSWGVNL